MKNNKRARKLISLCLIGFLLTSCASSSVTGQDFQSYKSGDRAAAEKIAEKMRFSSAFIHNGQEYQIYNLSLNSGRDYRALVYVDGKLTFANGPSYRNSGGMRSHSLSFGDYNFEGWMPMENGFDEVVASMSENNLLSESYIAAPNRTRPMSLAEYAIGVPVVSAAYAAVAVISVPFVPIAVVDEITSDDHNESELVSIPLGADIKDVNKIIGDCDLKLISRRSNYYICRYELRNKGEAFNNTFAGYKANKLIWKKVGSEDYGPDEYRLFYNYIALDANINGKRNKPYIAYAN